MTEENTVGVAQLKAQLSHYLHEVRAGRSVMVLDRGHAVARLVPVDGTPRLVVRKPAAGAARPGDFEPLPALDLGIDIVDLLGEERGEQ